MKQKAKPSPSVSPRPPAYKEVVRQYRLLQDLMDHIPDVIYFKDRQGRLIMVNRAHAKGLGLKPEQVVGKTDFDIFPRDRAEKMSRDDLRVLKTGKPIIDKIERATRPDGADNYVSTTKIPRYDNKGNIIGLVGITRDITRRMQFERLQEEKEKIEKKLKALEEASRLKSEFVSIASHELRTPLSIVKEDLSLLAEKNIDSLSRKQKGLLTNANINLERLKNIIDDLLDLSRLERGVFQLHYSLVNLNDFLKSSSDFFRKVAQQKHIHLEYALPRQQVNMFVDAERLHQVLSNLLNNAIRFTEEYGRIDVEANILEERIRIGVIDNGIGITKSDMRKLFGRFIQVSGIHPAAREGLGLGLSICKELVAKHGGEIWAESRLGVGSKFYFTLPRLYSVNILDKKTKADINDLLRLGISAYLINLLIINYRKVERQVRKSQGKLFREVKGIIDGSFRQSIGSGIARPRLVAADSRKAEYTFILPQADEDKAIALCRELKGRITSYLAKEKIENVFVNLGVLPYAQKEQSPVRVELPANIQIKKMFLGLEMRKFRRIAYKADIRILSPVNKTEVSRAVDISEGGVCYVSSRPLETEAKVTVRFRLAAAKEFVCAEARVAWIKNLETASNKIRTRQYKIGLEFTSLKHKDKKLLSGFINSVVSQP